LIDRENALIGYHGRVRQETNVGDRKHYIGNVICNFCNIGCNVVISGNVRFGNRVQVGANSFISNNIEISSDVIIAPGSVILKDIKYSGTYKDNLRIK
jgi:serine acetyltransferase